MTWVLLPREHGAYVQLLAPLAAALAVAPSTTGVLVAIAATSAFVASEPLRVLAGLRGKRLRIEARPAAIVTAAVALAVAAGGTALAFTRDAALVRPLALVGAAGLLVALLAWRRVVHTLPGEIAAAVALSGAAALVLVAGGAALPAAAATWAAWSAGYATTVIAVHHVLARRRSRAVTAAIATVLLAAAVAAGALATLDPRALAVPPLALASVAVVVVSPSPRRVRTVGVVFLIASLVSGGALVATA